MKQLEQVLLLIDQRDGQYMAVNKQIAELIAPTMLTAVVEILNVSTSKIEWMDLKVIENYLVLSCTVAYDPSAPDVSPLLAGPVVEPGEIVPVEVQKILRIGVPLSKIFETSDHIKEYLLDSYAKSQMKKEPVSEEPAVEGDEKVESFDAQFDPKQLTREQINQMMYFQHMSVGIKQ